ncbi:MAG: UDP-N-acetylmuramoyl-L-alanine--D-glutamate ligase [Deltaproteobacteria bacterium]|nr:UDP-N-acetylmuramoyl-L-alanine--D-glutamate ligase [Deltaproteobacteria bacterium]
MKTDLAIQSFATHKIGVLGVGVEGLATIDYLLSHGITDIEALDRNTIANLPPAIKCTFGDHYMENLERFDVIFRSPGIRPDLPPLATAQKSGTHITSAVSYFLENCPAKTVAITGTVGKGTASSLTAAGLEACGFTVHLGGNIGKSPLTFLDDVHPDDIVVLELSSFQTMDISTSPTLACILKTTSEHLDWHVDTAEYRRAKAELLAHPTEDPKTVFNADSEGAREIALQAKGPHFSFSLKTVVESGLYLHNNQFLIREKGADIVLPIEPDRVALAGRFNLENIAAAILNCYLLGGDLQCICDTVSRFRGLPHRLELVAEGDNVRYYNDSYATRPDAAEAAISSFSQPLALVMGGSEKNADFSALLSLLLQQKNIASLSLIGATAERMRKELCSLGTPAFPVYLKESLEAAMIAGRQSLPNGGVLLMAPACASFGLFKNYKDRGEQFNTLAHRLAASSAASSATI